MFDFKRIKELKEFNWKNLFEIISPEEVKKTLSLDNYNNILSGLIFSIIGHLFILISALGISELLKGIDIGLNKFGISKTVNIFTFIPIIVPIILLYYYYKLYKKQVTTNGTFNNIFVITYTFVSLFICIMYLIPSFSSFKISIIFALSELIGAIIVFLGDLFLLKGTLDYANELNDLYRESIKDNINHPNIKVKKIAVDEVGDHSFKFCSKCGYQMKIEVKVCPKCGNTML